MSKSADRSATHTMCWTALVAALLASVAASHSASAALRAAPPTASSVAGPTTQAGRVTIFRDEWGVPHVYAAREEDGFFGVGYALASDDLAALLAAYVEVTGQAAAAFGPTRLEADVQARLWRIVEDSRRGYARLPAQLKADHRAFIAGVRRYMTDHPQQVPSWAPQLQDWMPLAVAHAITMLLSVHQRDQGLADCRLQDLKVPLFRTALNATERAPPQELAAGGQAQLPLAASNQWVLLPSRLRDRGLLLWADSHSAYAFERQEVRIHAGNFHAAGIVPAGMALPIIGHNADVAWSFTVGGPDVSDCYEIIVDRRRPNRYRFGAKSKTMTRRSVTIDVKDGASQRRQLEYTDHNGQMNPVIARRDDKAYVIASAYMHQADAVGRQLYRMNTARNIEEFIAAHAELAMFPENVMAGDRFGRAYYVSIGRVPRRDARLKWNAPVSGNTASSAWHGIHPLGDLIQLHTPQIGWMQNNNIAPDTMIPTGAVAATAYPAYIFNDMPGRTNDRAERAKALLSEARELTIAGAMRLGMDELWPDVPAWQSALRAALEKQPMVTEPASQRATQLAQQLLQFDGYAHKASTRALAWYYWRMAIGEEAQSRQMSGSDLGTAVKAGTPPPEGTDEVLRAALGRALAVMHERHGNDDMALGDVFRIGRGARTWPMGGVTIPSPARYDTTLRATQCGWTADYSTCLGNSGQRHPMMTVFTEPLQSFSAVPFGQSGDASSVHHSDQSELASSAQLKPIRFEWADLKDHITDTVTLDIGKRPDGSP